MDRPDKKSSRYSWFFRIFGKPKQDASPSVPVPIKPEKKIEKPIENPIVGGFKTTFSRNNRTMLEQLNEARKYNDIIKDVARRYNIKPSVICGIGSRESHWGIALRPKGPSGRGDFARRRPRGKRRSAEPPDGGGYGRGLMQIDYDWHEFARTGKWYDPRENLIYACTVLDRARKYFDRKAQSLDEEQKLRAMLAAYNSGAAATLRSIRAGDDIDARTTGHDYSKDVLDRSGWFQLHDWE
ncbi:transglycosylase SLT domain-containing protein [Candidatus Halobeggiatoa sp. HSG11]|nr:transglycosylase SLT domain-containing protein [Candidatus Halobeggiatoa sp. HSG11]